MYLRTKVTFSVSARFVTTGENGWAGAFSAKISTWTIPSQTCRTADKPPSGCFRRCSRPKKIRVRAPRGRLGVKGDATIFDKSQISHRAALGAIR